MSRGGQGRDVNMDFSREDGVSGVPADLASAFVEQNRASPVCLLLPTSFEDTKGQNMEEECAVTPQGHSTEASVSVNAPEVQKVGTLPVQRLKEGTGVQPKQPEEGKQQRETNLEEWNKGSTKSVQEAKGTTLGRKDFWIAVATFILLGLNSLMAWNVMLNLAPYMAASYFGGQDCGNTFLACFQGACVIVQLTSIFFNCKPKAVTFYAAATVNVGAFLAVTPAAAYCYKSTALVLIHLICILWGAASGALQGGGYAYAGALPVNFAVFVSAGQGIAGLAAFLLNTLLGFVFFDINTYSGLTNQAWVLYIICSTLSALLALCIFILTRRPWARQPLQTAAEQQHVAKRLSEVVVRVVPDRAGGKLVGQRVHPNEEYTRMPADALSADSTRGTGNVNGREGPGAEWSAVTEAANSKDTSATLAVTRISSELSREQAPAKPGLTSFFHSSRNPSLAQGGEIHSDSAEVGDVEKAAEDDFCAEAGFPKRNLLALAKVMWHPLLATFVTFFVTLNLFPRIGPVGWHYTQKVPNHFVILFGIFSVADTLGRSTPSLQMVSRRWLGWTLIPERIFLWCTFARVLFYIPFFLSYKLENRNVLNDFWWLSCLMSLFAFTHGWCTSLGFIYAVGKVRESEKGIAGPLAVVALSLGILLGLYVALAY